MQDKAPMQALYSAGLHTHSSLLNSFLNFKRKAVAQSATAFLFFMIFCSVAQAQTLSTDEKIEVLGLAAQSTNVISVAVDGQFTLQELEQANKVKQAGISDDYIVYILINKIKLSEEDIAKTKGHISSGLSESIVKKSLYEKQRFDKPISANTNEQKVIKVEKEKPTSSLITFKNRIGVGFGGVMAVENFASSNPKNAHAGYARGGVYVGFNYAHYFFNFFGISLSAQYTHNFFDELTFANQVKQAYEDQGLDIRSSTVTSSGWNVFHFAIGPNFFIPFNQRNTAGLEFKLNGGLATVYTPKIVSSAFTYNNDQAKITQNSNYQFTGIIDAGIGFRFLAGSKTYMMINMDYLYTEISGVKVTAVAYANNQFADSNQFKMNQVVNNVLIGFSIGGRF